MTDQPSNYAADVECAIGLNVGGDGTEGVHAACDAVLSVRDREMERLRAEVDRQVQAKVDIAGKWGNALADKAAAEADLARVQQKACHTAEALRLNSKRLDAVLADRENERAGRTAEEKRARAAEARVAELEKLLADELTALAQPQQPTT
ncbi:hypothetical protein OG784_12940 [Streptomyces sp. NBC_01617]|uniref:hypothetical protein n=1 Tax=Streptomyces sp. NBC_01617 TaxID=2975899 RepID=UPI0038693A8E|nr:hypothetical protein OG784_12940 [Streptomyces sp. NBC_01617]